MFTLEIDIQRVKLEIYEVHHFLEFTKTPPFTFKHCSYRFSFNVC